MKPVKKIALRRIKRDVGKSLLLSVTVLVLMLMISFFVSFSYLVSSAEMSYGYLPIRAFAAELINLLSIAASAMLVISLISVCSHISMRKEDNRQLLAVLASVGAVKKQKNSLKYCELLLLFLPSAFIGSFVGAVFSKLISAEFIGVFGDKESTVNSICYILAFVVLAFGMLLFFACYMFPERKRSVINSVRKQNEKVSAEAHGYRRSETFKRMNCLKKLAKKSIDYYSVFYRKIAFFFASAVIYPIIGIFLFINVGNIELTMDANPYDGIDTADVVRGIAVDISAFFIIVFFVLAVIGILQAVLIIKIQNLRRVAEQDAYRRIGLTQKELRLMRRYEYSSVMLRSFIILVFVFVLLYTIFFVF